MASLKKRNGVYYVQFYDAARKPRRKRYSLGTRRKKQARNKASALERDWILGKYDPWLHSPSQYRQMESCNVQPTRFTTLGSALSQFLQEKRSQDCTDKTVANYRHFCGLLVSELGSDSQVSRVTVADITSLIYAEGISSTSCLTRFTHIRAWLRWCHRKRLIESCPSDRIPTPKRPKKMPKAVRPAQLHLIEKAMREDYAEKLAANQIREGAIIWMIPMFWFALYSGLRSSELGRLRWKHVDLERRMLSIYEQKNRKEQMIPVTQPALEILERLRGEPAEAYVFFAPGGEKYERDIPSFVGRAGKAFRRYRRLAGIEQKLTPHGLRHGFCTLLAEAGKPAPIIMEAARHSDISTSMRYVHIANEKLRSELDDVF